MKPLVDGIGVTQAQLDAVYVWTDVVRNARNAIHINHKPTTANTYEKVAVLFLEGTDALRKLYAVRAAALERGTKSE